jgi:uracil-DNA glycosylase family 4
MPKGPLPAGLSPETEEAVRARIRYFRDLGIYDLYRRGSAPHGDGIATEAVTDSAASTENVAVAVTEPEPLTALAGLSAEETASPMPSASLSSLIADPKKLTAPKGTTQDHAAALEAIRQDLGPCTRCPLHQGRHTVVFGDGAPNARLMFVGEGPGADEDAQGLPFVGRAGQLLNNMITAMGLRRDQVYIANIVKCRPPQNRVPEPVEANTCVPFLFRQIDAIQPEVIVALGSTAATYLLGGKSPLAALRGRIHHARGAKLIVTYHPAYLLRDPRQKKEAWADLQLAMAELGLKAPAK